MELKEYKLGDVCKIIGRIGFRGYSTKDLVDSPKEGAISLSPSNFTNGEIELSKCTYISWDKFYESPEIMINTGDIVLVKTGSSYGRSALVRKVKHPITLNPQLVVLKEIKANPIFLSYVIKSDTFQKEIRGIAGGSAIPTLSQENIGNLKIFLPKREIQDKIAEAINPIDNKIALNHQINDNLEALARQLYDYWFVQFDFPDENGEPYKSSGGKMVWNEELKREIPINWGEERLGKRCKVLLGGTPNTKNEKLWGDGYSWLNSGEVAVFPIIKSEKQITQAGLDSSATVLAPKGSVTLSITRYLRPSILAIDACINQSVVAIEENEFYKKEFIYPSIKAEVPRLMSLRTGAQQPHINKEIVENIILLKPANEIMDKYIRYTAPIYKEIVSLAQETENLTMQRDELLPLLMNGQVTVNYHL